MLYNTSISYISPGTGKKITRKIIHEIHSPTTVLIKIASEVEIE